MDFDDGHPGYKSERGVEVSVTAGQFGYRFSVKAEEMSILQGRLTHESAKQLRGDGPIFTCASIYRLIKDAASEVEGCTVFEDIE